MDKWNKHSRQIEKTSELNSKRWPMAAEYKRGGVAQVINGGGGCFNRKMDLKSSGVENGEFWYWERLPSRIQTTYRWRLLARDLIFGVLIDLRWTWIARYDQVRTRKHCPQLSKNDPWNAYLSSHESSPVFMLLGSKRLDSKRPWA